MTTLQVGEDAPGWKLEDGDGNTWNLEELRGEKVVIYFYPADDTPGCTTQACDFRDALPRFQNAGYRIFGISPQGPESHRAFAEKYHLNFPLLVDPELETAKAYGAVKTMGEDDNAFLYIKRSTFVIDEEGKIEQAMYGVRSKQHVTGLVATLGF